MMVDKPRYYVFCDSPKSLQNTLNELRFYDIKEAFVIPSGDEPVVCVIMEDPNEATVEKLRRWEEKTKEVTSRALDATATFLESISRRLKKQQ